MACPLPAKSSDAKSSELYTLNHQPYLPEPAYLHDFGQESGEKEKTIVEGGSLGVLRALLYSHNLRKERKGNRFPPDPMTTHIYVYPGGRRRAGMHIEYRGITPALGRWSQEKKISISSDWVKEIC